MSALQQPASVLGFALVAALAATLLLRAAIARRRDAGAVTGGAIAWLALLPFAWAAALPQSVALGRAGLLAALAVALLARDREDVAQSECALKLAWTLSAALALTWAGESLIAIAAGSTVAVEQWPALALQLDPYALWTSALALTLLAAVVLVGGAPFHFWVADVVQGTPAWLSPLLVAGLQTAGAALLVHRLEGLQGFTQGESLVHSVLQVGAVLALLGGAATLAAQRRPERRIGTLASLQGGLVLTALAADPSHAPFTVHGGGTLAAWSAHLALALAGAGAFARFLPVDAAPHEPGAVLFRRHPWSAAAGAYALLSLAGVPGTPGARLWLAVARELALTHHAGLALALAFAWLTAFAVTAREVRNAWGSPSTLTPPQRAVPRFSRAALWAAAAGLAGMMSLR
jgi:NADH:ubiquinone oxidoreductase subunit 2 (subunit N)